MVFQGDREIHPYVRTCPFCKGEKLVMEVLQGVEQPVPCPKCEGTGQIMTTPTRAMSERFHER